jgi:hypothetical protein
LTINNVNVEDDCDLLYGDEVISLRLGLLGGKRPVSRGGVPKPRKNPGKKAKGPRPARSIATKAATVFAIQQPPGRKQSMDMSGKLRLSECATKFALAVIDPFDIKCFGACNPGGKETLTQKTHCIQRFVASVGTNGFGFLNISPSLANDCVNAQYSGPTFTGSSALGLSATNTIANGVSFTSPSTLPYNATNLAASGSYVQEQVTGRIVSVGARLTNIGTTLNESGMYYGFSDPNHFCTSGSTFASISGFPEAKITPVNKKPYKLSCYPINQQEDTMAWQSPGLSAFTNLIYPYNGNGAQQVTVGGTLSYNFATGNGSTAGQMGTPIMTVMFSGVPGNQIQVELITHVEYSGYLTQAMSTRHHNDIVGRDIVGGAVGEAFIRSAQEPMFSDKTWNYFVDSAVSFMRDTATRVVNRNVDSLRLMN